MSEQKKWSFWQQGRLLSTPQTRKFTPDVWARYDAEERRRIFIDFRVEDQGRSRERIADFLDEDNAARAVEAVNFLARFPSIDLSAARVAVPCRVCNGDPTYCDGCVGPHAALGDPIKCRACHDGYTILEPAK